MSMKGAPRTVDLFWILLALTMILLAFGLIAACDRAAVRS